MESGSLPDTSLAPSHPLPTKVSSITTTHENKGVSITRSHEVPGKSSTDGTSSTAGKSASLSLDALAKAKKALQMQKELAEKMKKIPLVSCSQLISKSSYLYFSLLLFLQVISLVCLPHTLTSLIFMLQLNKGASSSSDANLKSGPKEGMKPVSLSSTAVGSASSTLPAAAAPINSSASGMAAPAGLAAIPNIDAVKRAQELAARMGFRQDPEFAPLINMFPGQSTADTAVSQKPTKAPVLRLDALGREIDEHGNVVNVTKPSNLSTLKVC